MVLSTKNNKSMARKRKQIRLKQSMIMTTIGCSAALSGIGSHLQCDAFSPPSMNGRSSIYSTAGVSRMWYRNGDEEESESRRKDHNRALSLVGSVRVSAQRWRINSIIQQRQEIPKEQQNIDEYLKFLDRRYNRLHSNEKEQPKKRKANFTWNWIFDSDSSSSKAKSLHESMKEDALYVLGVAELASSRLLQKHPSSVEEPPRETLSLDISAEIDDSTIIDSQVVKENKEVPTVTPNVLQDKLILTAKFFNELETRKSAFLKVQLSNVLRLVTASSSFLFFQALALFKTQFDYLRKRIQSTSILAFSLMTLLIVNPLKDLTMNFVCS